VQYTWKFDQKNVTSQRIVISQNQGFTGFRDANGISNCDTSCVTRATSDNSDRITVAGNTASFTQNVTSPGQKYWWKVRVNGAGGATWSKTRSFTIKGQDNLDFSNTSVNWNSNAYRNDNIFWKSGFAPKRFSPPSPQLGNAKGNCTWYAHGRARQLGFSSNLNSMSSNAKTWANAAKNSGILVDQVPSVGAIAQTTKGGGGFGHVAFIEKVNSNGTLLISESSYAPGTSWDFEYRTRTVNKSDFENYIHVKKP
jgi:surface antigen